MKTPVYRVTGPRGEEFILGIYDLEHELSPYFQGKLHSLNMFLSELKEKGFAEDEEMLWKGRWHEDI